jgi:enoyl-CoA hydratase/carnithine racemase
VDQVQYGVEGGVGTITLNNPGRNNAWNPDMERQYFGRLDQAAGDDAVRAIVVTGAGSSFCPGLDSHRLGDAAASAGLRLEGRRSQHYALTIHPALATVCAAVTMDPRFLRPDTGPVRRRRISPQLRK